MIYLIYVADISGFTIRIVSMASSLLTTCIASTDMTLKPAQRMKMTFSKYFKVLPCYLPTVVYKVATLAIVATLTGVWVFIQYLIIFPSIATLLLITIRWTITRHEAAEKNCSTPTFTSAIAKNLKDPTLAPGVVSSILTVTGGAYGANDSKNTQVNMMRYSTWFTLLFNILTLVICYILREHHIWFARIIHLEFQHAAPWFRENLLIIITVTLTLGLISCIMTEVYMKLAPHLVLFQEDTDTTENVDEDPEIADIEQNETEDTENIRMLQRGPTGRRNLNNN